MAEVTLSIQIAEDLQRQVEAAATMRGESLSDVVRSALEDYVKAPTQPNCDAESALKNDSLLSLRFKGGPGNVSERVTEILQDASDKETGLHVNDDGTH